MVPGPATQRNAFDLEGFDSSPFFKLCPAMTVPPELTPPTAWPPVNPVKPIFELRPALVQRIIAGPDSP